MDNKHSSNKAEASSEEISNNCTENTFDKLYTFVNSIKVEKNSNLRTESCDLEDTGSIAKKSSDNKNKKQQQKMCELASTYYEKDVNVSESNSLELTHSKLVGGKIVSMHTSIRSTALPIMKILSPKSGPHTCLQCCFMCLNFFRVLDSPSHICQIRSTDKQNEFLKINPSLCVDSCLCGFCWKYLENTYKSNTSKNTKCYVKKKQARKCSIHLCSQPYCHKMSVNECENIKKIFLTFASCHLVFVKGTEQTTDTLKFPFCLCEIHNSMILVMSTCQICGDKLNEPFNTDDWSMYEMWNIVLIENNLPLTLKPGMFICVTCKGHISKTNPGFPTIDLLRYREYILISNATRSKLYGESQYNLINIRQESNCVASPIVVPKINEEKECARLTKVKFSAPSTTKNDTESIMSTALLNVSEQNLGTDELEPKDEGLNFVKLKEKYFKSFTANKPKDQLFNFHTNSIPNTNGIEMTNSLNLSVDDTSANILSEQNPSEKLTDNNISNNFSKHFSSTSTNHVVRHDNTKDLLQLDVDHQLKNYGNKISKTEGINQYFEMTNDNSLQNVCDVDNVEIDENELEIIGSHQAVNGHNDIENNLKEVNQSVEPPNAIVNPVSINEKQSNVIWDTISNKDVKKQKLNEKYCSYENNSTDDNTTKFYRNKIIDLPSIYAPNILNMTSSCKKKI